MERRRLYGGVVVIVGVVLAVVQVIQAVDETTDPVVLAVDALPMVAVALALAYTGTRLARDPVYEPDLTRILGWTVGGTLVFASFAALTLFGGNVATGILLRPERVAVDNLTVGATAGVLVGLYDARGQHRLRQLEVERDRSEAFASKAADLNNYGRAIAGADEVGGVGAFCIEAVTTLLGFRETAVVEVSGADVDEMRIVGTTITDVGRERMRALVDEALDQEVGTVVVHDGGPPVELERSVETAVTVRLVDHEDVGVALLSVTDAGRSVEDGDRQLLELLVSHAGMALEALYRKGEHYPTQGAEAE